MSDFDDDGRMTLIIMIGVKLGADGGWGGHGSWWGRREVHGSCLPEWSTDVLTCV